MITQIEARYFRRLMHIDLALAPGVTLVLGENGAGKSSLAAAVEFALTGACRWTDRRGAGYKLLINHEAAEIGSTVVLQTDVAGLIERQLTPDGTSLNVDGRGGGNAKALLQVALPEPEVLNAILRSDGFTSLSPKEQQEILFMLDGGRTGADWFREHLTSEECEVLDEHLSSRTTGSALAEKLHQSAYSMRTMANKQAAAAKAKRDQYQRPAKVAETAPDDELREELAALRAIQATLHEQIGAADAARLAATKARTRQATAEDEVARIKSALGALGDAVAPTEEEMSEAEMDLAAGREALADISRVATEGRAAVLARKKQLERFVQLGSGCVLGKVECPMDDATRQRIIDDERGALQEVDDALVELQGREDEVARSAGEAADAVAALRDRKVIAESIARDRERLTEDLTRATKRLNEAQEEAAEADETDVEVLREEAADVSAKIADYDARLSAATRYQEGIAEYERLSQEADAAIAKADLLNQLVAKLAPDGLPAQAMGSVVGEILSAINGVLAQFTDFQLTAAPGADFILSVVRDGFEMPVFALSESEELRVGAAIQVALAALTGFGFVVVDAADRLDAKNRERLLRMLAAQEMVQALVLATPAGPLTASQLHALATLGVKVVEITEGEVVREAAQGKPQP